METFMASKLNPWLGHEPVGKQRAGLAGVLLGTLVAVAIAPSAQAASVPLGTTTQSAVLAGSTITNTGPSVVSGDLGLSPGTVVSGFPPGLVLAGTIHKTDAVAVQAKADLVTAYNDVAGRSSGATISADLAGNTLSPGVYSSAASMGLTGDLALDAQGDPSAVFIFQVGSTLTAGSGSRVRLLNGARACNVFWQVGSSATIGSTSAFTGNILAMTSITLITAATLNGRALARNGAVTLDSNIVTKAPCGIPPTATDTSASTGAGQPVTVVLHGTDATGAPLTYTITGGPSHGTLGPIDQGAGTVIYTPDGGYEGPDTFIYEVSSSGGTSNPAGGSITINPSGGDGALGGGAAPGAGGGGAAPGAGGASGTPGSPGAGAGGAGGTPGAGGANAPGGAAPTVGNAGGGERAWRIGAAQRPDELCQPHVPGSRDRPQHRAGEVPLRRQVAPDDQGEAGPDRVLGDCCARADEAPWRAASPPRSSSRPPAPRSP